jgi:hypothetical protein
MRYLIEPVFRRNRTDLDRLKQNIVPRITHIAPLILPLNEAVFSRSNGNGNIYLSGWLKILIGDVDDRNLLSRCGKKGNGCEFRYHETQWQDCPAAGATPPPQ